MKIALVLHTSQYRGDHDADIEQAFDLPGTATIDELAQVLVREDGDRRSEPAFNSSSYITVRLVHELNEDHGLAIQKPKVGKDLPF